MKREISENFCGLMDDVHNKGEFDASFHVTGNIVTILPHTDECRKRNWELSYTDSSTDKSDWLFGYAEDGCRVAFLRKARLSTGFSTPVNLQPSSFFAPIILKSVEHATPDVDFSTFDAIEFRGGIVDILHNPGWACCINRDPRSISFPDESSYTKQHPVEISGETFDVTYSIDTSFDWELGKTPDLRKAIHSTFCFDFNSPKKLEDIEKYYGYAMEFFQFCCGRLNICFEIRIYKNIPTEINGKEIAIKHLILVKFKDGFEDYANDVLDLTQVIRLNDLGDNLAMLMKTLVEENTRPHLLFLPKKNTEANSINYTDVVDLCTALTKEYYLKTTTKIEKSEDIFEFSKEIEDFINSTAYSDNLKNRAQSLLGNLKYPSPKMIISYFYDEFKDFLGKISRQKIRDKHGSAKSYSDENFKDSLIYSSLSPQQHAEYFMNDVF